MARFNMISATLTAGQKADIQEWLSNVEKTMDFLISFSKADKKRLIQIGPRSLGYLDACIAVFDEFSDLLPRKMDLERLKRERALYNDISSVMVKMGMLQESMQDTLTALAHDMMSTCNDGYAILRRSGKGDHAIKAATQRIGARYKANGRRTRELVPNAQTEETLKDPVRESK